MTKEVYINILLSAIGVFAFGIYLLVQNNIEKDEYNTETGTIKYIKSTHNSLHPRDHRYIHLDQSPFIFDVFIGKRRLDFSPTFEQIDSLEIGDSVTIYFGDKPLTTGTSQLVINKTVQYIDKEDTSYFIRGKKDKYGGYIFTTFGFSLLCLLFVFRNSIVEQME